MCRRSHFAPRIGHHPAVRSPSARADGAQRPPAGFAVDPAVWSIVASHCVVEKTRDNTRRAADLARPEAVRPAAGTSADEAFWCRVTSRIATSFEAQSARIDGPMKLFCIRPAMRLPTSSRRSCRSSNSAPMSAAAPAHAQLRERQGRSACWRRMRRRDAPDQAESRSAISRAARNPLSIAPSM